MEPSYDIKFRIGKYWLAVQYYPESPTLRRRRWYWFIGKDGDGYYQEVIRF